MKAREEAPPPSRFPSPSKADGGRRRYPADAARGRRRLDVDAGGRPGALVDAEGVALAFEHDGEGSLRRVSSGDWFVAIDGPASGHTFAASDPAGRTEMLLARGGKLRTLTRGTDRIALEFDAYERVRRVELPGSANALAYEWDESGGCVIRAEGGGPLLTLSAAGMARRMTLDDDTWWEEEVDLTRLRLRAAVGGAVCDTLDIRLENLAAIAERRWSDGSGDRFTRDAEGRLASWTRFDGGNNQQERHWRYDGGDLVEDSRGTRTIGEGGRVIALESDAAVAYRYNAAGHRTMRIADNGETRYFYDPLGTLTGVRTPDGRLTRFEIDGMGRRVAVRRDGAVVRHEHRDEVGRLWAVTDARGEALHVYIWMGDRIVARIDGAIGAPVAEAYLCDLLGTPNGVLIAQGDDWRFERVDAPPYGRADDSARPTLYSHFGDPETGLIHFGARDFDPELGLFLTPDPWHGGEDDPRRWAGAPDALIEHELPQAGVHTYALCRFDPLGRYDRDGHASFGSVMLHIVRYVLMFTWGFPLTAVSIYFFEPFNLYMEIVGLIVWLIKQGCEDKSHPWGNNTIAKAQWGLGSTRQATFALGLNGFLPRVVSGRGLNADRAVTVGNVIWINSVELDVLARAEVVEVDDIGGGAAGPPAFNDDSSKQSVVALLASDKDAKQQLHVSAWTRGMGNAVALRAPPAGTAVQAFGDRPGGHVTGGLHLRHPVPVDVKVPRETGAGEKLEVREFLRGPGDPSMDLETTASVWFSLKLPKDTGFVTGNWLRITAPKADPKPDAAFLRVREVLPAADHAALILNAELPPRFQNANISAKLLVETAEAVAGETPSESWAGGATLTLAAPPAATPGYPPNFATGAIVRIDAAAPAPAVPLPGVAAGAPELVSFAEVKAVRATLTLTPNADGIVKDSRLRRWVPQATAKAAGVIAKKGERGKIVLVGKPSIAKDDLLIVTAAGVADPVFVRAKDAPSGGVLEIDPALPEAMAPADAANVALQLTKASTSDTDIGTATGPAAAANVEVAMDRTGALAEGHYVRVEVGGVPSLRKIGAVTQFGMDLTDTPVGTGPYKLTRAKTIPDKTRKNVELAPPGRFLKKTGASGVMGDWPTKILAIELAGRGSAGSENPVFYVRWPAAARPPEFHPGFHNAWSLIVQGADEYVVLETPLPLVRRDDSDGNMKTWWRVEPDDYEGYGDVLIDPPPAVPPPPLKLQALEYGASAAVRADKDGRRVLACEPETLVPISPKVHDTHRRALIEHELHHTVQCNFWGPLMTALPLSGLIMSVTDLIGAAGVEMPEWLHHVDRDAAGNHPSSVDGRIPHNTELNPFEVFSIGGLLQLSWKYAFLAPFHGSPALHDKIVDWDFEDMVKVFNPVSRLVTQALPQVDANAPAKERWGAFFAQLLSRALDMRSWTPFTGFVPTLLPDGPTNFIEQGASRASGDLYSTILTANDRFNLRTCGRLAGSKVDLSADLHSGIGRPVRLLLFPESRFNRVFESAAADVPGTKVTFRERYDREEPITITLPDVAQHALFQDDLYEVQHLTLPAPAKVTIEGPPPARTPIDFMPATTGDIVSPRLRALVPLPPRVNRTLGFYMLPMTKGRLTIGAPRPFMVDAEVKISGTVGVGDTITLTAAAPGVAGFPIVVPAAAVAGDDTNKFAVSVKTALLASALPAADMWARVEGSTVKIYLRRAQTPAVTWTVQTTGSVKAKVEFGKAAKADAYTESVTLTITDEVKLDGEEIPWSLPAAVGAVPAPAVLKRYQTELCELRIRLPDGSSSGKFVDGGTSDFVLDLSEPSIAAQTKSDRWILPMPAIVPMTAAAPPAAKPVRLRLFRVIKKTDPGFDLVFADVPSLKDVPSYLDADTFAVVRDVHFEIEELPAHLDQSCPWNTAFELKVPIKLEGGAAAITVKPPLGRTDNLKATLIGDDGRGQKWSIGPLPEAIGDDVIFTVEIAYGPPGALPPKSFKLTFKAAIKVTGLNFNLLPGTAIEVDIAEGTPPYTITFDPPLPGLGAVQTPGKATLLASGAPEAMTDVKLIVTDKSTPAKMGLRHLSVKNMPPILLPNDSTEYFDYIRPATRGLATPLINGRSSGGAGPNVDFTEPLDAMENAVKALGKGDSIYLSSWFFGPATKLTAGGLPGITNWGQLLAKKASDDVSIRLLINDFDPISGLDLWLAADGLDPLNTIIDALPVTKRDNLKYIVCMHPAHVGKLKAAIAGKGFNNIYVASHHQKFMVVRKGTDLTAFCGGIDIERRKAPDVWNDVGFAGWHDIHLQLEGPITRDLEREFIERWNRSRPGSRPAHPGWSGFEDLAATPLSAADDAPAKKVHLLQMTRTVSEDGTVSLYSTKRDDIKQTYRRGIQGAKQFLYLENQYFRSTELADWIVAAGVANPALVVIMVVIGEAEDGKNMVTQHGDYLQFQTFDRIHKGLGARAEFYMMHARSVHSKFLAVDDAWMTIGSANANVRSFELDSELNVQIADPALTKAFRTRLWARNLGETEATVAGWAPAQFLARWRAIALANRPKALTEMAGAGILLYDYTAKPGVEHGIIPDALVQLDFGKDGAGNDPDAPAVA